MKHVLYTLSACVVIGLTVTLFSCSSSSPTPTTTKAGSWDRLADFGGFARSGAASFVIGNFAYLGGGFDGVNRLNDFWQFDPNKNTWVQKTDFPGTARSGAVGFSIGDKGYVGLGIDINNSRLKDFWEFDPAGNSGQGSWKKIKDFGGTTETGRYGSYSFTVSNRGFVGGGFNGNAANDLWEYLPASNTWVQRTSNSSKRVNAVTFVINNLAYLIGGANNGLTVKTVEQYDPVADSWNQKAQLTQKDANGNKITQPLSREFAVGFTIGSNGYITGGSINTTPVGDTWQYDPSTDTWVEYYLFSTEARTRDGACGFGIGNFGYVATGRSGNLRFDDTWVFDPTGTEDNGK